jgi:hypothetical protein
MAEISAVDRKQKLLDSGPQVKEFTGRNGVVNTRGLQKAKQDYLNANKATLDALDRQIEVETRGQEGAQSSSEALKAYLASGEHRAWEGGTIASMLGSGYLGHRLGNIAGEAPAGSSTAARVVRTVLPMIGVGMSAGKAGEQYLTQPDQTADPRGYDLHNLGMSTFGALGAGGIEGALRSGWGTYGEKPEAGLGGSEPPPVPPREIKPYKVGTPHGDLTKQFADHLGVDVPSGQPKRDTYPEVAKAVGTADEATIRGMARASNLPMAATAPIADVRTSLLGVINRVGKEAGSWKGALALLGGSALLDPEGAKAAAREAYQEVTEHPSEAAGSAADMAWQMFKESRPGAGGAIDKNEALAQEAARQQQEQESAAREEQRQQAVMSRLQAYAPQPSASEIPPDFQSKLNEFDQHLGKMRQRYGGGAPTSGSGAPIPGNAEGGPPMTPMTPMPSVPIAQIPGAQIPGIGDFGLGAGTRAMLGLMANGRRESNALALLMGHNPQ